MSPSVRRVRLPREVHVAIRIMHPQLKQRIRAGLDTLRVNPSAGKPLRRELSGWWSFRVGRVRIIYRATRTILEVSAIGSRASIYKDTTRRLARASRQR
ncbi:MAG: type II toxin-antitoxin system RelE/ParE family toxin [Desulfurellaceae bacterium]|nr:type II toxin-antitoxin system RelE/ParE family toxin [Desulfurellaceae bacterium]